jgi:hypothetical protein
MKSNSLTYILVVLAAFCLGCEKFEDDTVDFSNRYPAYVDFAASSTALTAAEGKAATFQVNIRPIQYQDVTVNYTVTGAVNTTGQAVIPSGTSNVRFTVPAPANNGTADGARAAVVKLTGVTEGYALGRVGRNIEAKLTITD